MPAHAIDLSPALDSAFARDVARGLAAHPQKSIPSQYLYDELGSILFDAITLLPEYGLTRADIRLLRAHSSELLSALPANLSIVELGSGTGSKTRWILEAAVGRAPVTYYPIDISATAVNQCASILESIPGVAIAPQTGTYLEGLAKVTGERTRGNSLLVLFLGSTIGNFDYSAARAFLREIRSLLHPGDSLLLGTDLIKPLPQLLAAYDDSTGVTAAFNLNLLGRLNRELGANFNLREFAHEVRFPQGESRIEMHLRSRIPQTVEIEALEQSFRFRAGETIWTEGSYKFRRSEVKDLAGQTGFVLRRQWIDHEWPFAETLFGAA
ncbi:MAG: L-histidine N(alpha)-methyltransferase [Acidobacteriota bacterium]|nr:L-histidine N(alpha)-methyltransferase [Acidobacteriota bacterium]